MAKEVNQPTDEQIRTRAYYLWEADGCPQGRDWEYWLRAKNDLTLIEKTATATAIPTRKPATPTEAPKRRASRAAVYA